MKRDWSHVAKQYTLQPDEWIVDRVLIEYDGPELVVLSGDPARLAVLTDSDVTTRRWLVAPMSRGELTALLGGQVRLRDLLAKPEISLVDETPDGFFSLPFSFDMVRPEDLPAPWARLPDDLQEAPDSDSSPSCGVILDGPGATGDEKTS